MFYNFFKIHEIHINWKDPDKAHIDLVKKFFEHQALEKNFTIPLHIFTSKKDTMFLNHRWASFPYVKTKLVYILDDDMLL